MTEPASTISSPESERWHILLVRNAVPVRLRACSEKLGRHRYPNCLDVALAVLTCVDAFLAWNGFK